MGRRTKGPNPESRGWRVQQIKDAYDEKHGKHTVEEFAEKLNAAAVDLGLEPMWNAPRFSKVVHGQEPSLEDAACLLQVDPEHRTWDWLARGPQQRQAGQAKRRAGGQ